MYVTLLKHWRATSAMLPQRETTFPTDFLDIPAPACAVEEAGETIQGAQIEEGRGLALYLRPQEIAIRWDTTGKFCHTLGSGRQEDALR